LTVFGCKQANLAYLRFQVGHNAPLTELTDNSLLQLWTKTKGTFFLCERVQAKILTKCGWLLG